MSRVGPMLPNAPDGICWVRIHSSNDAYDPPKADIAGVIGGRLEHVATVPLAEARATVDMLRALWFPQ